MKTLPYFRWYPADAETDELYASLNDAELGFFHRLLNRSWINCGLPGDFDDLARAMKVRRAYLDKVWAKVGRCFVLTETVHPRWVNPRQEEEREHALAKSERATDSVRTRYERRSNELPRVRARAAAASESQSKISSVPEFPEDPPVIEHHPETTAALVEMFPDTDEAFVRALIQKCVQEVISANQRAELVSDAAIAAAIRRVYKRGQNSAGLFLTTVPNCIKNWATTEA